MVSATWMVDKADQVTRGNKKYVGRLFPGIISAVNIAAKTYAIAYDDGCTETDVPFEGRVTLRTQLTAKEKTRATLAAKKERLARVEAEAAALERLRLRLLLQLSRLRLRLSRSGRWRRLRRGQTPRTASWWAALPPPSAKPLPLPSALPLPSNDNVIGWASATTSSFRVLIL